MMTWVLNKMLNLIKNKLLLCNSNNNRNRQEIDIVMFSKIISNKIYLCKQTQLLINKTINICLINLNNIITITSNNNKTKRPK